MNANMAGKSFKVNLPHYSCPENPMDRGSWRAAVHGVAESDTTEVTERACMQQVIGFMG